MLAHLFLLLPCVLALPKRQESAPSVIPDGWSTVGCYTDSSTYRTLNSFSYIDVNLTIVECLDFCASKGARYAGAEYGAECYCDSNIQAPGFLVDNSQCNMPCGGNGLDVCGSGNRLSVYWSGKPNPTVPQQVNEWRYQGCYLDTQASRSLSVRLGPVPDNAMTIQACTTGCQQAGFSWSGLEYAQECWCGNAMLGARVADTECQMTCTGDSSIYCGGNNRLTAYYYTV